MDLYKINLNKYYINNYIEYKIFLLINTIIYLVTHNIHKKAKGVTKWLTGKLLGN